MSKETIQNKLEKVRLSYIASLIEKRDEIQDYWAVLRQDWDDDAYNNLYLLIHSLAGSAETFGFPDITDKARAIINYFKESKISTADTVTDSHIDTLIKELKDLLGTAKE